MNADKRRSEKNLLSALIGAGLFLAAATGLWAHVGSPDIYYDGQAGPYRLAVAVRPPPVIPGVAEIEVRSESPGVSAVHIVPTPLAGPGARFAPASDLARRSRQDPQFFTGSLWMMQSGSWQVRVRADGAEGSGELSVPVPALSSRILTMQKTMGAILLPLLLLLSVGVISIVGASVREAPLEAGAAPDRKRVRRSRTVMAVTAGVLVALLWLGNAWWNAEAGWYGRWVFKPLQVSASLEAGGRLVLRLSDPGWLNRRLDDFVPDHGHLMHLYVIRLPEMERVWHLHPEQADEGVFVQALPPMPAGRYALFGDLVHADGLPETVTTETEFPEVAGRPPAGDDAAGSGPPLSRADYNQTVCPLAGGGRMVWEREGGALQTRRLTWFRFRVEDADGRPAKDLELYMGMPGHAAFVRTDLSVFAHVHPSGSVPMPALALARASLPSAPDPMRSMNHAMHSLETAGLPAVVSFPYGFPRPGSYRIFVQVKRAGRIETGLFDAKVEK